MMCLFFLFAINIIYAQNNIKGCPDYPEILPLDKSAFASILQQINTFLSNQTSTNNVPGLISTIVYDQQQIFTQGYGSRNVFNSSSPPPSGDDLVEIASITKTFTDLFLYYLRDIPSINVNLNDPITKYLPTFKIKNPYNNDTIKLIHLATQTSGLQRETPNCDWTSKCNEEQVLQALSESYLTLPPYSRFHYSNLGISLLGRALEKVYCAGCYEKYMKQLILNGLGLSTYSGFNFSQNIIDNYVAAGVAYYNKDNNPVRATVESLGFENPAGGMLANANDLAKLMSFMFRNNETVNSNKYQLLNGSTINEIFKPKILLRDGYQSIANPWEMEYRQFMTTHGDNSDQMSGVWYRGKEGELSGYRSAVVMVPDYKIGVFHSALISEVNDNDGHVWTYDVLDMLLPYLDELLYKNGNDNRYVLPDNYELLIGKYVGISGTTDITVGTDSVTGLKYLTIGGTLRLNVFKNELNGEVYDKNVFRAYSLHESACRWLDDGTDQELVYFYFVNGESQHATGIMFMGGVGNYTTT